VPYYCGTMSSGAVRQTRSQTYAVITGGGTAGHVFPALAIAELLIEAGQDPDSLLYVGSRRGPESALVPEAGLRGRWYDVRGVRRSLVPTAIVASLKAVALLVGATISCWTLLRKERPRVVVSVGGYASMPATIAARLTKTPVVTCSYDLRPGWATKLQARWARSAAVAYLPSTLPRAELAGAPVRRAIRQVAARADKSSMKSELGFADSKPLVVVMGGSLGSVLLNGIAEKLRVDLDDSTSILHLCGERYFDPSADNESRSVDGAVRFRRIARASDMALVYGACDLMVMRGGASSVAEVAVAGVASVIVPWKDAAEDHQTMNARLLADHGAAIMVREDDETIERAVGEVRRLLADHPARATIARIAHDLGEVHRHPRLVEVIQAAAA
jgi:UDP-N-acetylglucosamine--N-acetylmuramyl-(pentapeptide) pyrophosphoryl-undecaprenol N-acetylglucosamine transferase